MRRIVWIAEIASAATGRRCFAAPAPRNVARERAARRPSASGGARLSGARFGHIGHCRRLAQIRVVSRSRRFRPERGCRSCSTPPSVPTPAALEEAVQGAPLASPLVVHGDTVLPRRERGWAASSPDATRSGSVKGRAHIAVRFDTITPQARRRRALSRSGRPRSGARRRRRRRRTQSKIGGAAAGGAIIGAIVGRQEGRGDRHRGRRRRGHGGRAFDARRRSPAAKGARADAASVRAGDGSKVRE